MKTRTLLLLAIGCGLAILVAGGIQLLRVSGRSEGRETLSLGATAKVGGMEITLIEARSVGDLAVVTVRVGGVDDDDVSDGFRLNVDEPVALPASLGTPCGAVGAEASTCSIAFDLPAGGLDGAVLVYIRADQTARWSLG